MDPYDRNDTKKWKLKRFRKGHYNDLNFQVENMKNKIKEVKHPNKKVINVQNIEPLINVLDEPSDEVLVEDVDSDSDSETDTIDFVSDDTDNNVIREGIESTPKATFTNDMYTNKNDDIYEGGDDNGCSVIGNAISSGFDDLTESIDNIFYNFASIIVSTDQNKRQEVRDTHVIKKYIFWFFSVLVGLFVVLNWFLVSFFRDEEGNRAPIFENTTLEEKNKHKRDYKTLIPQYYNGEPSFLKLVKDNEGYWKGIYGILYWFLRYPFIGTDTLMLSIKEGSPYIGQYVPTTLLYILILFICIVGVYYLPRIMANIVSKSLQMDVSDPYLSIVQTMLFIAYFLSCITSVNDPETMQFWITLNSIHFIGGPIIVFLMQLALLLYVFLIAPIIFCIVFSVFILYYSIVPIFKMSPNGPFSLYKAIISYIEYEYNYVSKNYNTPDTVCKEHTFFEMVSYYFRSLLFLMYKYCHIITFFSLFIAAIIEYSNVIKTDRIKNTIIILTYSAIIGLFAINKLLYYKYEPNDDYNTNLYDYNEHMNTVVTKIMQETYDT